jgi:hypothetical protein
MGYTKKLTVPANTLLTSPVSTTIVLSVGILNQIQILFPYGCARAVHVQIYDGATLVYPKNAGEDYAEDGDTKIVNDFVIYDSAKTLTLKGWSPGTTYPHIVTFSFLMNTVEENAMKAHGYY